MKKNPVPALAVSAVSAVFAGASAASAGSPDPVAIYPFNGDLTSLVPGAPDIQVVNPGGDAFLDQSFVSRTTGTWSWPGGTGLVLDTNALLPGDAWTVGITFRFDSTISYNKILDTQNRTLDTGWYNDPSSQLRYFPEVSQNPIQFISGDEITVVIAYDGDRATGYVDGVLSVDFSGRSDAAIGPDGLLHFFLDDLPFAGEVSSGTTAAIFVWDEALDPADVAGLLPLPQLIEPCGPADKSLPYGLIDLADINAFVTAFTAGDPAGDLDGNGLFDLGDVLAFIEGFTAGCP